MPISAPERDGETDLVLFPQELEERLKMLIAPYAQKYERPQFVDQIVEIAQEAFAKGQLTEANALRWFWEILKDNHIPFLEPPKQKMELDLTGFLEDARDLAKKHKVIFDEATVRRTVMDIYNTLSSHKGPGERINYAENEALKVLRKQWKTPSRPRLHIPSIGDATVREHLKEVFANAG